MVILCAAPRSVYKEIPGLEVYDQERDARTWPGGSRCVAHPPCKPWSRHCRHQAKFEQAEMDLGPWCVEALRKFGGILEHPAGSLLFAHCALPRPGQTNGQCWTASVWQAWWGYPMKKETWLCFFGIPRDLVTYPFKLHARGSDRRTEQLMSHARRSATTRAFAEWLIEVASIKPR
jgi:hypothetical protein